MTLRFAWIALAACASGSDAARPEPHLPERAAALDITHGALRSASVRGVARASHGDRAAMQLRYHGPTRDVSALASGTTRRQVGLKLRAADSCNVIYVMWRITDPAITVQVKSNPGRTQHTECGIDGYRRVRPSRQRRPALPVVGHEHALVAAIDGDELTVWLDHAEVWRGVLPVEARALHGPAGFRADNVDVDVSLFAD